MPHLYAEKNKSATFLHITGARWRGVTRSHHAARRRLRHRHRHRLQRNPRGQHLHHRPRHRRLQRERELPRHRGGLEHLRQRTALPGSTPPVVGGQVQGAGSYGDGDTDVVIGTGTGTADVWFNDGQGRFSPGQDLGALGSDALAQFILADLDGDGGLDLVFVSYGLTGIWFNDGHGAPEQALSGLLSSSANDTQIYRNATAP